MGMVAAANGRTATVRVLLEAGPLPCVLWELQPGIVSLPPRGSKLLDRPAIFEESFRQTLRSSDVGESVVTSSTRACPSLLILCCAPLAHGTPLLYQVASCPLSVAIGSGRYL